MANCFGKKTHYQVLDVLPSATADEIRKAYKQKALKTHPDKTMRTTSMDGGLDSDYVRSKAEAEAAFRLVQEAFDILGDPQKRRLYDLLLSSRREIRKAHSTPAYAKDTSDEVLRRMREESERRARERKEWARKEEDRHQERMRSLREASKRQQPPPDLPPGVSESDFAALVDVYLEKMLMEGKLKPERKTGRDFKVESRRTM